MVKKAVKIKGFEWMNEECSRNSQNIAHSRYDRQGSNRCGAAIGVVPRADRAAPLPQCFC
jgi:hypothetical protein